MLSIRNALSVWVVYLQFSLMLSSNQFHVQPCLHVVLVLSLVVVSQLLQFAYYRDRQLQHHKHIQLLLL